MTATGRYLGSCITSSQIFKWIVIVIELKLLKIFNGILDEKTYKGLEEDLVIYNSLIRNMYKVISGNVYKLFNVKN